MELLAPVGTLETFHAALDGGADAVYVGAPDINARSLARDLRFEEIAAMISTCHSQGKKLYLAANSLLRERDLSPLIRTLAILDGLAPDALIIQDLGLIKIVNQQFPNLALHASTLMGAHNHDTIEMFAAMGCERVVLARELTLKEIDALAGSTRTELEVFVHGAMCFSYSGLCLFSSFLGGKSGLRGRCVQPCRRRYEWGFKGSGGKRGRASKGTKHGKSARRGGSGSAKGGYLFSMNDLSGLEAVPQLKKSGIASLKIEGRLRTAHYVNKVVQAYRQLIDADEDQFHELLPEAVRLVEEAMGRRVSPGYFVSPQPATAITPFHSGNMGLHLGRLEKYRRIDQEARGRLALKTGLQVGDRLRCHFESSGERKPFTLKKLLLQGKEVDSARQGERVEILLPDGFPAGNPGRVEVYKVDVASRPHVGDQRAILETGRKQIATIKRETKGRVEAIRRRVLRSGPVPPPAPARGAGGKRNSKRGTRRPRPECWLKLDTVTPVFHQLPFKVDRWLFTLDQKNVAAAGKLKRHLGKGVRDVIWCLPPILLGRELGRISRLITTLSRSGFRNFQLGHIAQADLFADKRVHLLGDYTLNLMNHQALLWAGTAGLEAAQLSIELDRKGIEQLIAGYRAQGGKKQLGMTVYGTPPLFTARLAPGHFQYNRQLKSPRDEMFVIKKKGGFTQTFSKRPFSLLGYLAELKEMGLDYGVIDLTNLSTGKKELQSLADLLSGKNRYSGLPTFNYLGRLE